jgi:hypothetical protein
MVVRKRGVVFGKGLTAGNQPALSTTARVMRMAPLSLRSTNRVPMASSLAEQQIINDTSRTIMNTTL